MPIPYDSVIPEYTLDKHLLVHMHKGQVKERA